MKQLISLIVMALVWYFLFYADFDSHPVSSSDKKIEFVEGGVYLTQGVSGKIDDIPVKYGIFYVDEIKDSVISVLFYQNVFLEKPNLDVASLDFTQDIIPGAGYEWPARISMRAPIKSFKKSKYHSFEFVTSI